MDAEFSFNTQILSQIKVFYGELRGRFAWSRGGCPQKEEEHVKIYHVDHVYILNGALFRQLLDFLSFFGPLRLD